MSKKNNAGKRNGLYKKSKVVSLKDTQNVSKISSTDSVLDQELQSLIETNPEVVMAGDGLNRLYMNYGKMISELYQTMCNAAVKMPFFSLQSNVMDVVNDSIHLSVVFHRDRVHGDQSDKASDYDNDDSGYCAEDSSDEYDDTLDDSDIEEGLLYED